MSAIAQKAPMGDRTPPVKISQLTQDSLDEDSAQAYGIAFIGFFTTLFAVLEQTPL